MTAQLPTASPPQSHQRIQHVHSIPTTPYLPAERQPEARAAEKERSREKYPVLKPSKRAESIVAFQGKSLSRKVILDKIGCQPKDRIEEAVCKGDQAALTGLLQKKKGFWQSKFRKHLSSERVTALHFAALFGEIGMARSLLDAGFNVNEVPHGYSSQLTPLKFAIGAREVGMVQFLISNGAKPSEPDSWSTLADQLMNRSWLMKTVSEADKEFVPSRIIAILKILLTNGWDVNGKLNGGTVLHQAVSFWTGSYQWDLNLRTTVASFLCECDADPFLTNKEGKTAYEIASESGHKDLLLILDRSSKKRRLDNTLGEPFELSS